MENSKRSRASRTGLPELLDQALPVGFEPGRSLAVALSGGVDSVALLHAAVTLAGRRHLVVTALHVNHGISPHAAHWERFCRDRCRSLGVPIRVARVRVPHGPNLEARARDARYRAFLRAGCAVVALGHNLDDQAETVLLQMLRGSGVDGIAGMPRTRPLPARRLTSQAGANVPVLVRPWLEVPRCAIEHYARGHGLDWIEDESNREVAFDRNFLRHELFPVLERRFPAYRESFARMAANAAEASRLLADAADRDIEIALDGTTLDVGRLRELGRERAKQVLRRMLSRAGCRPPPALRLEEAVRQALEASPDTAVAVDLGDRILRRHRGRVALLKPWRAPAASWSVSWRGERRLALPELGGILGMRRRHGQGISARLLQGGAEIRLRSGGERLRPHDGRPGRTLKVLLQEADLPSWERGRLPLLYIGDALVWVPGIGTDLAWRAAPGEAGIVPEWRREDDQA